MDGNLKITIISTFSPKHYKEYGKYFVNSLKKYIHHEINVVLYTDIPMEFSKANFSNRILNDSCPDLVEFKNRNQHKEVPTGTKGWMKDAVRFSHKSYCIVHASQTIDTDLLIWLDADTEILSHITPQYLSKQIAEPSFVSYLGREGRYSETGWLCFDMRNQHASDFFNKWKYYYDTDEIYNLPAQLDCHVFDAVRIEFREAGKTIYQSISIDEKGASHFDKRFIGKMCHYKGDQKTDRDSNFIRANVRAKKKK